MSPVTYLYVTRSTFDVPWAQEHELVEDLAALLAEAVGRPRAIDGSFQRDLDFVITDVTLEARSLIFLVGILLRDRPESPFDESGDWPSEPDLYLGESLMLCALAQGSRTIAVAALQGQADAAVLTSPMEGVLTSGDHINEPRRREGERRRSTSGREWRGEERRRPPRPAVRWFIDPVFDQTQVDHLLDNCVEVHSLNFRVHLPNPRPHLPTTLDRIFGENALPVSATLNVEADARTSGIPIDDELMASFRQAVAEREVSSFELMGRNRAGGDIELGSRDLIKVDHREIGGTTERATDLLVSQSRDADLIR